MKLVSCYACVYRKSQTRCETGTESHGSLRDSRVAWKGHRGFFIASIHLGIIKNEGFPAIKRMAGKSQPAP
jgi:hypothetical protein